MRDKIKCSVALSFLKKQRADIVVLVEIHVEGRVWMALKRPWVGWAFHSTHTSHARGVSILVAKSIHFELCEILTDPQGRYVFLYVKRYGQPFLLLAFYIPPPFCATVLTEGFAFMARHSSVQTLWLGDFNTTLDPNLDRPQPLMASTGPTHPTRFSRLIFTFQLIDTWTYIYTPPLERIHVFQPPPIKCLI